MIIAATTLTHGLNLDVQVQKSGFSGVGPQQGYFLLMRVTKQDLVEDSGAGWLGA